MTQRRWRAVAGPGRQGYTLVEMLVTLALLLGLMVLVTQIFSAVNRSITGARSTLEMTDRLRAAVSRLRLDLAGATADLTSLPGRPAEGKGYFEYIEGPIGPVYSLTDVDDPSLPGFFPTSLRRSVARQTDQAVTGAGDPYLPDNSAADSDDILLLTVRSRGEPFTGKTFVKMTPRKGPGNGEYEDAPGFTPPGVSDPTFDLERAAQSPVAEVVWFVRGTTLYRRVLLVLPDHDVDRRTPDVVEPLLGTGLYYTAADPPIARFYGDYFDKEYGDPDHRAKAFHNNYDLSARLEYNPAAPNDWTQWRWVPNTLGDLTMRENRFAHQPAMRPPATLLTVPFERHFPFNPHMEILNDGTQDWSDWRFLRLPTLGECSHADWVAGWSLPYLELSPDTTFLDQDGSVPSGPNFRYDPLFKPLPFSAVDVALFAAGAVSGALDPATGNITTTPGPPPGPLAGPRASEDVVLTNVIGFNVTAWDPEAPILASPTTALAPGDPGYAAALAIHLDKGAPAIIGRGAYVDLGYAGVIGAPLVPPSHFSTWGDQPLLLPRVYDTWSIHYEHDGVSQNMPVALIDEGTDGFDNNGDGVVDDPGEREAPPPYSKPLRGIQIKIRVREPDSREIREVTIIHDFLPQ
ncbi:MAG: prepilin-type N-terminal cleavage/methylation domain-containing protein [Pirellulales bacterium]|nr:prepilin-type N-terminal cleavage/methylation domain-containing protein [Pirellulales bacterium]